MLALTVIWLIVGLLAMIVMLILSLCKRMAWKKTGISALIYVVVSVLLLIVVGSEPGSTQTASQSQNNAKIYKLMYNDDEDYYDEIRFDSNKQGQYTLKIKGLQNGNVTIKNDDDSQEHFKPVKIKVRKDKISKYTIKLADDDFVHDFVITDGNGHSKTFKVYNNSDAANSSMSAMSSSSESSSSTSTTSTADLDQALADRLNEEKGYDAAWSKFVDNVTYDGDKITIELNASADALTDPELQVVARMSQGMALNVLNEQGEISDSKAGKGMPTFWTRNGHQVGYAAKRNYHLYFFK